MQAGPGKQVSQEQWLQHYALRDDLVCESWLSAAERSDKHEPQCRATWRALGHLASVDGKTPGPLDAEEFEARLAADLREHGVPTTWDGFVLQYNRLLQQRAEAFAADWVLEEFLDHLDAGTWPPRLAARIRARHTLLAHAFAMAGRV